MEKRGRGMSVPSFPLNPNSHWSVCPVGSQLFLTSKLYLHVLLAASQDIRSHTKMGGVSSKSGIDQKGQKLWACGLTGAACTPGTSNGRTTWAKSKPSISLWEESCKICLKYWVTLGKSLNLSEP